MTKIVDQYGNPLDTGELTEPQTARVSTLQHQYLTPMLSGLTPARLQRILREADNGSLIDQHRLFSDMEERDAHLAAEMGKRKGAVFSLPWDVVPPDSPTAEEKADAEWAREALRNSADAIEDLIAAAMDAVGHGFSPVEIEWRRDDGEFVPMFHPRPQEWFQLSTDRREIRLMDGSVDGAPLQPFGWMMHTPLKPKTGYASRMGLHRTLVWPFIYKAYALGDFAEFLETYGLPIILGKYNSGATAEEKASLMAAVTRLGHDARAIMPTEMLLEVIQASGGSGQASHMVMMEWADKAESKVILGQTLSADAGGRGSYALGKVHNEVRHDIRNADARQVAATITRDVVFPMLVLNRPGVTSLKRCPRFVLNVDEPEDLTAYANSLPPLVAAGMQIPVNWAHQKLAIPMPANGEPVLVATGIAAPGSMAAKKPGVAAATAQVPSAGGEPDDPTAAIGDELATAAAPSWVSQIEAVKQLVDAASSMTELQGSLVQAFGGESEAQLVKIMSAAFALAELKGMSDAEDGA